MGSLLPLGGKEELEPTFVSREDFLGPPAEEWTNTLMIKRLDSSPCLDVRQRINHL